MALLDADIGDNRTSLDEVALAKRQLVQSPRASGTHKDKPFARGQSSRRGLHPRIRPKQCSNQQGQNGQRQQITRILQKPRIPQHDVALEARTPGLKRRERYQGERRNHA
jgi:hypothetical protein